MSRKPLATVPIDKEELRKRIYDAGYSLRGLVKELSFSRETFQSYWRKEAFPEQMLYEILDKTMPPFREVWVRIGVTVKIPEDELMDIMDDVAYDGGKWFDDYDISEKTAMKWMKSGRIDGESYIPGSCFDDHIDWYKDKKEAENAKVSSSD